MSVDLRDAASSLIDLRSKGFPGAHRALPLGEIGRQGWNVLREDLPLPLCVIRKSAVENNRRWMRDFLAHHHAVIAPHGKTTMSPQLFKDQLDDGAWAITVGNIHQIQVARSFGFDRIILANQLVGKQAYRYVLDEMARDPKFEFFSLVDSVPLVRQMAAAAASRNGGRPLNVFLEGGILGKRTGVRDLATAREVARAVKAAAPHLELRGVEGFEGLVGPGAEGVAIVQGFLDFLAAMAKMVDDEDLAAPGPLILTAGGTAFYDLVVKTFGAVKLKRPVQIMTRSGCYITHDSQSYENAFDAIAARTPGAATLGRPLPALEVWAYVQSRPEPTRALVTMGKRDVSGEPFMPVPVKWFRPGGTMTRPEPIRFEHKCSAMNDQHGYLDLPADSPLAVGDLVGFGASHPCLTFDKWQVIMVVDDDYNVVDAIRTYF
jgi:D-serine dehydratase